MLTILTATASSSVRAASPTSQGQQKEFVIIVSQKGFNGTADNFNIKVKQGDLVKITFIYGDNDLPKDNPHQITIDGYNIKTDTLGKSKLTVTVQFTADQVGDFNFYCSSKDCTGMDNLQSGNLNVTPA